MKKYGIDISLAQGEEIDFEKVKASGKDFCICKATQGRLLSSTTFDPKTDHTFTKFISGAIASGLKVGVYHYMMGTTIAEVDKEADYFISKITPYKNNLHYPAFIDIENADVYCKNEYKARNTELVIHFANKLSKAGFVPGITTFKSFLINYIDASQLGDIPLWYSRVDVPESTALSEEPDMVMWQYSWNGSVSGISGNVDLDVAFVEFPRYNKLRLKDNAPCYIDYARKQLVDVPSMTTAETLKSYFVTDSPMHMVSVTPSNGYVGPGTTVKLYSNDMLVDSLTVI